MFNSSRVLLGFALASIATVSAAQDKEPWRYRVTLGAALVPAYPGADKPGVAPLIIVNRARGDKPFAFAAPDDGAGFSLTSPGGWFQFGPVVGFEGKRKLKDTNGLAPEVKFSIEAGAYAAITPIPSLRFRIEGRKGVTGHKGLTGSIGADYIARDADKWLFSIGPRLTWSDGKYQRAYFGVPAGSALPAYRPGSGLQAVGGTSSVRFALNERFGVYGYGKYDRLIDDAGRSQLVRAVGSRNQYSGGLGLSYTFGG